ncbi:MAG: OPT/YSL family transporter, partial [Phycisphaerales bacterium JB039]
PEAPEVLVERVDRDRDGQADLLVTDSTIDVGRAIGLPDSALLVFAIAPFALGAGYLSGKAGLMVLAGGVLAYLIVNPILFELGMLPGSLKGYQVSTGGWGREHIGKPLGIGLLLGGALMGVVVSLPSIGAALRSVASAKGARGGGSDELGLKTLGLAAVGAFCLLFLTAFLSSGEASNRFDPVTGATLVQAVGEESAAVAPPEGGFPTTVFRGYTLQFENAESLAQWEQMAPEDRDESLKRIRSRPGLLAGLPPVARALLIALIGTVWIWFSGIIIAQCTGMTDWSPISGIALLTVVLVMILAGVGAVIPAVLVGATLCCAITMSADMMADLRTGSIVGALPRRQQLAELATTWIGPVICMLTVLLIAAANMEKFGVPMGIGTETGAPQAEALKSVINGVQGGEMPYAMYGFGTLLGLLLGLGSFAGLGVLIGLSMYLPFIYISTYGIGCIINITLAKVKGRTWAEEWGVPFAAGLIVGEAILSLIINAIIVIAASMGGGAS